MSDAPKTGIRLLVIDEKSEDIDSLRATLEAVDPPYEIHSAKHGRDALWQLKNQTFDLVALSSHLRQGDAINLLQRIRDEGYEAPVVFLGDIDSGELAVRALNAGAADFISKRFLASGLLDARFRRTVEIEALRAALHAERDRLGLERSRNRINRMKSEFLANTSHELRTPLSAILGYSEILRDELKGKIDDELFDFLVRLRENAMNLLTMVNTMLDYASMVTARDEVPVTDFHLKDVVAKVLAALQPKAQLRGIPLVAELDPPQIKLVSEPARLQQALFHLLDNAIKFSPEPGEIRLRARLEGEVLTLEVQDQGIGVPQEHLDPIFEPFAQADSSATRRYGGLGMGLTTARGLVESLGGRIGVQSVEGKGSLFTISLPRRLEAGGGRQEERQEEKLPLLPPASSLQPPASCPTPPGPPGK